MTNSDQNKKQLFSFEKLFMGFYAFVFLFAAVSFGFFVYDRDLNKKSNSKDIQINVIDPGENEESVEKLNSRLQEIFSKYTTVSNPAISDTKVIEDVMKIFRKSKGLTQVLLVDKDGVLNPNLVRVESGDTVSFLNNTGANIDVVGDGGWGSKNIKNATAYSQVFFPNRTYTFTVLPQGVSGKIVVDLPSDFAE